MNTPISWIKAYVPDLDVTAQEFVDDLKKERIEEIIQSFDEQLTGMGFSQDEILELLKEHFGK